jgi:hypothetical protein
MVVSGGEVVETAPEVGHLSSVSSDSLYMRGTSSTRRLVLHIISKIMNSRKQSVSPNLEGYFDLGITALLARH